MTLMEIAERIRAHLRRIEYDPTLTPNDRPGRLRRFYRTNAWRAGSYVQVQYVGNIGATPLRREEALAYLAWLDAGNVGQHGDALVENGGRV